MTFTIRTLPFGATVAVADVVGGVLMRLLPPPPLYPRLCGGSCGIRRDGLLNNKSCAEPDTIAHSTHFHVARREEEEDEGYPLLLLPSVVEELEDERVSGVGVVATIATLLRGVPTAMLLVVDERAACNITLLTQTFMIDESMRCAMIAHSMYSYLYNIQSQRLGWSCSPRDPTRYDVLFQTLSSFSALPTDD